MAKPVTNTARGVFLFLIVGSALLCFFIAFNSFSFSAIGANPMVRTNVTSLTPEGWAFFTRNPREDKMLVYKKEKEGWRSLVVPNTTLRYCIGLDRGVRKASLEAGLLLKHINKSAWKMTEGNLLQAASADTSRVHVTNNAYNPMCEGELLIAFQPLKPWAWCQDNIQMPSKYVILYVDSAK